MKALSTITLFLNEAIFPGDEKTCSRGELYDKYRTWCKEEDTRKPYGKHQFYEMIKLEPRVEFKHKSYGDYFIFTLDEKKSTDDLKIPF